MAEVKLAVEGVELLGELVIPDKAKGVVVFAHGAGSGRLSKRNQFVASELNKRGLATLLFDLLTEEEDKTYANRFEIDGLTRRLTAVVLWCREQRGLRGLALGLFGASTGAAAALKTATQTRVQAVVSRGGRVDMAGDVLDKVAVPTLFIVGGNDGEVVTLNEKAFERLNTEKRLEIVPGATHLFEEPGALEKVAELAGEWFEIYLSD